MSYEDIYNYLDETITLDSINHPNLKLDELEKITKKKTLRLFRKGKYSKNINRSQLLMSIIMAASRIKWSTTDPRGIREFWYNPVKPIFYRVYGAEIDDMDESAIRRMCDVVSHTLSVMVQSKILTYEDLGIVDFRTQRMLWERIDNANCWSNVVLFVEKDSAYIHLRPLKNLLNITLISGAGVSKTALNEYLMKHLPKGKYKLFTFTDYDPWGFFISGECFKKLERMGWEIDITRIGLDIDQVDKEILGRQKYPVKMDHNGQVWAPKYGILGRLRKVFRTRKKTIEDEETGEKKKIDERYLAYEGRKGWGLEIEAISGQEGGAQKLREIVLKELLKPRKEEEGQYLDETERLDDLREPMWEDIHKDTRCYPTTKSEDSTYNEYVTFGKWRDLSLPKYLIEDEYDHLSSGREDDYKFETIPIEAERDFYGRMRANVNDTHETETTKIYYEYDNAKRVVVKHLKEQIQELQVEIDSIEAKVNAVRNEKLAEWRWIAFLGGIFKAVYESRAEALQELFRDYDYDITSLKKLRNDCRYVNVAAYVDLIEGNQYHYLDNVYDEDYEDLQWGLTPGIHKTVLEEKREKVRLYDITRIPINFEKNLVCLAIKQIIADHHEDDVDDIRENIIQAQTPDEDKVKEWNDKWGKYLEEEE